MERIYQKIGRIREYVIQVRSMEAECLKRFSTDCISRIFRCLLDQTDGIDQTDQMDRVLSRLPRLSRYGHYDDMTL
jgi:hypothetical protein